MSNIPSSTDPVLQILQKERDSILQRNPDLSDQDRHQLWIQRQAQLVSLIKRNDVSTTSQYLASIPRSMSYAGQSSAFQVPSLDVPRAMNRTEGFSHQSAPAAVSMSRSASTLSTAGIQASLASDDWNWQHDEPTPSYTLSSQAGFAAGSTQPRTVSRIDDVSVYHPNDYVATLEDNFGYSNYAASPTSSPNGPPALIYQDSNRLTVTTSPYQWSSYDGSASPSTPTTGELTTASTFASEMSRDPSFASTNFSGALDMMRLQSNRSILSDFLPTESPLSALSSSVKPGLTDVDSSSFLGQIPLPAVYEDDFSSTQFPSCTQVQPSQSAGQELEAGEMMREPSTQSNKSTSSRSQRRHKEQLAQGSRLIAPKAEGTQMIRVASHGGASKTVAPITKAPYVRPTHPKIMCDKCNDYPDGFRGEHELRRHTERAHARVRRVWITVDASADKKFLANCKQCRQNKKYGAYYNAAAHLRRAHFHPRKRGRKGKNDEKRGGKGGGDDPPMEILKQFWMKEIEEVVDENLKASTSPEVKAEGLEASPSAHIARSPSETQYNPFAASTNPHSRPPVEVLSTAQLNEQAQMMCDAPPFDFNQMGTYNGYPDPTSMPLAGNQVLASNADEPLPMFQFDDQQQYNAGLYVAPGFGMQY